ncbi:hypothetical protein D8M04_00690 [Oceanobacillus piezotolerans]|uniref:Uncharacterized protein n=1 Tax=Oceanobacillus piezotolerans TaxID=2448030 RepID=A0A498DLB5_9BACI|nr:hypothetical protein [Oceanobacillus piezotolerans]RLL47830.1 hypothetical protein D8M04_00690 [Oceanobacillus piezotolerans]
MIKDRRINKPSHIKALMQEQINILRRDDDLEPIAKAKAIAYLSSISLSAYKEGETARRLDEIEQRLEGYKNE